MRRLFFIILFLIYAAMIAGCALTKSKVESIPPPSVNSILATLQMRYDLVDSMKTWMNVSIESDEQAGELRAILYYQKPDKLRVDAMGALNDPKAIITAVEESFRIYFVPENEVMKGKLSDGVIKEIFDVDLRVSDVRSSIFANPFLDGNISELAVEGYGDEWLIRRPSTLAGHREEISILARNTAVSKWQVLDGSGKVIQEISFSRYQKVGEILRPLKATIYRPMDNTRISIESVEPEVNMELAEHIFDIPIPESATVIPLSRPVDRQSPDGDSDSVP